MLSLKVKSAIQQAQRSLAVNGNEAMAVAALLQLAETLQLNLKAAIKENADWYGRFMPLTEEVNKARRLNLRIYCSIFFEFLHALTSSGRCMQIMGLVINRSLVKLIQQVIDEDGSVKDSAVCSLLPHRVFIIVVMHIVTPRTLFIYSS